MAVVIGPSYAEPGADDPDQNKSNEDQIDGVRKKVPDQGFRV